MQTAVIVFSTIFSAGFFFVVFFTIFEAENLKKTPIRIIIIIFLTGVITWGGISSIFEDNNYDGEIRTYNR